MARQLSEREGIEIVTLGGEGWTQERIAEKHQVNKPTISKILKKQKETSNLKLAGKNGRPSKCTLPILNI